MKHVWKLSTALVLTGMRAEAQISATSPNGQGIPQVSILCSSGSAASVCNFGGGSSSGGGSNAAAGTLGATGQSFGSLDAFLSAGGTLTGVSPTNKFPVTDSALDALISSGALSVGGTISLAGTPSVSVSGTPTVTISGTPSVAGTVSISGTPTVNLGLAYAGSTSWSASLLGLQSLALATSVTQSFTAGSLEPLVEGTNGYLKVSLGSATDTAPSAFTTTTGSLNSASPIVTCAYDSTPYDVASGYTAPAACDTAMQYVVDVESQKSSYGYSTSITPPATPTDVLQVCGSATKLVRVHRVHVTANAGTLGAMTLALSKRSTADTGGTSAAVTAVPMDANNSAATESVLQFSANPGTLGTAVGAVDTSYLSFGVSAASPPYDRSFGAGDSEQSIVLRGTASCLALNLGGGALPGGGVLAIGIETTEE